MSRTLASEKSAYIEARNLALRAKQLGGEDPLIYSILSDFAIVHGDPAEGIRLAEKALSLILNAPLDTSC